jgi:hypothetical protein
MTGFTAKDRFYSIELVKNMEWYFVQLYSVVTLVIAAVPFELLLLLYVVFLIFAYIC